MAVANRKSPSPGGTGSIALDTSSRVGDITRHGLSVREIAEVVGVSPRQVSNWVSRSSSPQGANLERLLELHYVVEYLADTYSPEGVQVWVHSRNRLLDDARPIDLMIEGRFQPVLDLAIGLSEGFPA